MLRLPVIILFLIQVFNAKGQYDHLLAFDARSGEVTIQNVGFDQIRFQEKYRELFYNAVWSNHLTAVESNKGFTEMLPAKAFTTVTSYPSSATVKIITQQQDSQIDKCTGMLVGDRYVLTAGHCAAYEMDDWSGKMAFISDLYVQPAFDNGTESEFGRVKVLKSYVLGSYFTGRSKKDIALLELDLPIGNKTGWVNMGFEDNYSVLKNAHYINFSYPMDASRLNIAKTYNGDTMYFKYGIPSTISSTYIGIKGIGIPGESGSLLLKDDPTNYTAYGVRNFSEELYSFYRLQEEDVSVFYSLMNKNETVSERVDKTTPAIFTIFPNPVLEKAIINTGADIEQIELFAYDQNGLQVQSYTLNGEKGHFVFENHNLPRGSYVLIAKENNRVIGATKIVIRK